MCLSKRLINNVVRIVNVHKQDVVIAEEDVNKRQHIVEQQIILAKKIITGYELENKYLNLSLKKRS